MKLICFPNNTAGGLICNLFNKKQPIFVGYKTVNNEHNIFKFEDTPTICNNITDKQLWFEVTKKYKDTNVWYGTHVHPIAIPNLQDFDDVLLITTQTEKSKLYRWLRYYYGWFYSSMPNWVEDNSLEKIDKIRELCKNVFVGFSPFDAYKFVEFEDIVSGKFIKENNLNSDQYHTWCENNKFLYTSSDTTWATQRFYEAKFELETGKSFAYV